MRNILLCSPLIQIGGISQWTKNILDYFQNQKEDVNLEWYYPTNISTHNRFNSTKTIVGRIIFGFLRYVPFIIHLRKHINTYTYDVIHLSTSGSISFIKDFFALKYCKKHNITTVLHLHFGRMPQVLKSKSFEHLLFKFCTKYIDKLIAIDESTFAALLEYGLSNVYYIPNPLSPKIEQIISSHSNVKRENNLVVFAGHVIPSKGIFELTTACSNIPNVTLEFLGQITENTKSKLHHLFSTNDSGKLILRGNCTLDDVINAMKRCSVFVLPSYTEGFPNVIIESMACGCAIITTPVGAIPEMLDSNGMQCGIIVPTKDSKAIHNAVSFLLNNPNTGIELGKLAQQRVKSLYRIDNICHLLKTVWEN